MNEWTNIIEMMTRVLCDRRKSDPTFLRQCNTALVCPMLVYVCVLVLEVGGGVLVSDETDRVWSEALFALTCFSDMQ